MRACTVPPTTRTVRTKRQASADSPRAAHARTGCPSAAPHMPCSGRHRAQQPWRLFSASHAQGRTTDSMLHDADARAVHTLTKTGPPGALQSRSRRSPLGRLPCPRSGAGQRRGRTSRWLASSAAARCCGTMTSFCLPLASAGCCASAARDAADGPCAPAPARRERAAGGQGQPACGRPEAAGPPLASRGTAGGSLRAAGRHAATTAGRTRLITGGCTPARSYDSSPHLTHHRGMHTGAQL